MTEANHSEPQPTRRLFDVKAVARVLGISWRTVLRLADAGKVPHHRNAERLQQRTRADA